MKNPKKLEQNKEEQPMSLNARAASVGFFGGLIWAIIGYVAYVLNFTEYGPAMILWPFILGEWKNETLGHLAGIVVIALVSILVALFYKFVLAKFKSMLPGLLLGAALWGVVFYLLHPIFPGIKDLEDFHQHTIFTTVCLYLLYGLFIGYSISFDTHQYNQSNGRKEQHEAKN